MRPPDREGTWFRMLPSPPCSRTRSVLSKHTRGPVLGSIHNFLNIVTCCQEGKKATDATGHGNWVKKEQGMRT